MNRTFYNVIISLAAVALAGIFVVFALRTGKDTQETDTKKDTKIEQKWQKVSLVPMQGGLYTSNLSPIENINAFSGSQGTPILVDFGRLGSFLYLSPTGSQSGVLTMKSATGILLGDAPGIISLYDLFLSYSIFDTDETYRLDQITNGSFYIGKEKDGKTSIYAIDGVIRLTLLYNKEDMTSLILFPGSYIRFDPTRNRSLKNADLFRTILSLKDIDNEVFEFINPRVNIGVEDTFFNYRLPKESMNLFRILSTRSREKVETTNISRRYVTYGGVSPSDNTWLMNPSKKNHNMLLELSGLLGEVIQKGASSEQQITQIASIYNQAKDLKLQDATAKSLVEQFLLDGRFAVYGGVANSRYQESYEAIARMIGIQPTSGKLRLFQGLADIYSRNLFTQKRNENSMIINTYGPTSLELTKTLDQDEIDQKDYFDIAIYAFNILKKMEKKPQLLVDNAMEDPATYSYLTTFFQAASRYINSIADTEKQQQTIMSFARQFYDYILGTVVNSLYKNFTVVEDGALYLQPRFREGIKVTIPDDTIAHIQSLEATVELIVPSMDALWSGSGQTDADTYDRIHTNIIRLSAFEKMSRPDSYKAYIETPYQYDSNNEDGLILPVLNEKRTDVKRLDKKSVEQLKNAKVIATDPRIKELKKIWSNAEASNWSIEGDNIRIVKAPYRIARSDGTTSEVEMSALYKEKTFTDGTIKYNGNTIRMYIPDGDALTIPQFTAFLADLQYYFDTIDARLATADGPIGGEMRIFPMKQRVNIGDSLYTVNIK